MRLYNGNSGHALKHHRMRQTTHKELQAGGRASSPLCFLLSEPLTNSREGFGVRHLHKAAEDGLACYRVGRANNLVLERFVQSPQKDLEGIVQCCFAL